MKRLRAVVPAAFGTTNHPAYTPAEPDVSGQDVDDLLAFLHALDSDGVADVVPRRFPR